MKLKTKAIIATVIIVSFIGSNTASFISGRITKKDIVKIITKTETKTKTVYRDYPKMELSELAKELKKYDTGNFVLDGRMISDDILRVNASLYQRSAERDFKLKAQSKNDNETRDKILCFFGGMVAGGILGGYVDNRISAAFK